MAKVTNISTGPRGAYQDGVLIMAEKGETIEADDYAPEWFKSAGKAADEAKSNEPKALSSMNKAELLKTAADEEVATAKNDEGADIKVADATNKQIVAAIEAKRATPVT